MNKPILYTTGCPKCKILTKKLDGAGIDYEICNNMEQIISICNSIDTSQVPILKVEDCFLTFADAVKWINERRG